MSFVPTRFIHASNLHLDHQPQGIGKVDSESQMILEDCTLTTFEQVIKAALEHEIDFLLLTGNTLIEEDHSIRAKISFVEGLQQLASENIQVFILPGQHDPLSVWHSQFHWPGNVTFLSPHDHDIIDIMRADETIATLQVLESAHYKTEQSLKLNQRNQLFNQHDQRAISIGILPAKVTEEKTDHDCELEHSPSQVVSDQFEEVSFDYIALCKGTQRHTFEMQPGIAHHPGVAQGLNFNESDNNGVTLVTIKPEEQLELHLLNLATVRWLVIELQIDPECSRKQLKHLMREALFSYQNAVFEKVWMVRWQWDGSGELFQSLNIAENQSDLGLEIASELRDHLPVRIEQCFELQADTAKLTSRSASLVKRYHDQLEAFQTDTDTPLKQLVTHVAHLDQTWSRRMESMIQNMNEQRIFNTAIRNGHNWLNISSDEEVHL
ncbi:exonuclease SbcCD subunit D [Gimesia aquarii]|uniref:Putative metallophosphoesterase YhaO n=1 Tax=Gimesia aquarii TaxID=2527964 RepID=A0A517WP38_9PLAN|nr:hypothetical protein [Gimesia aquarii]QDU07009.1 putative metallophosphoesterase YhaO [Gimesia aquarii]